jgi:transposase
MEYGAIDLHKQRSQIRIVTAEGAVVLERRIDTTREDLTRVFGERPRLSILIESSTESEWAAQHLEQLGQDVIVVDPNYAPMYGPRSRRVKTDTRDAAALAEACRTGVYRRAHRASAGARALRRTMRVRSQLVRQRAGLITLLRSLLRQEGLQLASGTAEGVLTRLATVPLSDTLARRGGAAPSDTDAAQDDAGRDRHGPPHACHGGCDDPTLDECPWSRPGRRAHVSSGARYADPVSQGAGLGECVSGAGACRR